MSRKICFILSLFVCLGIVSNFYFLGTWNNNNSWNKNRAFCGRLSHLRNSTYTVIGLVYYTDESKADKSSGVMNAHIGRGVALYKDGGLYFLSVKHVFTFDDKIAGGYDFLSRNFRKAEEHFFIVHDWLRAKNLLKKLFLYAHEKADSAGLFSPQIFHDILKARKHDFDKAGAMELDIAPAKRVKGEDIVLIPFNFSIPLGFHFLSMDDFDLDNDYAYGRRLAIWGNPNGFGEFYREGVISSPYFCDPKEEKTNNRLFVASFIAAHGDSGSPVFALAKDGRLKIVGFCSMAYPASPRLCIAYKITSFFEKLGLPK